MIKIFLDTNILLDIFLNRDFEISESKLIFEKVEQQEIIWCISSLSFPNFYYIARKFNKSREVFSFFEYLLLNFEIVDLCKYVLEESIQIDKIDFEDNIQYVSAINNNCEYIITRNKNDFMEKWIYIVSPKEFTQKYFSKF